MPRVIERFFQCNKTLLYGTEVVAPSIQFLKPKQLYTARSGLKDMKIKESTKMSGIPGWIKDCDKLYHKRMGNNLTEVLM